MNDVSSNVPAIDIDMLTMALQAGDLDTAWWLDTVSGHVIPAPEADGDHIEQELIAKKRRAPARFIEIEPIEEVVHIELMTSYVATLDQDELCESLNEALQRKRPVWHFKNALASAPEHEDNWYEFKEQFYAMQARQWLRDRELEPRETAQADIISAEVPVGQPVAHGDPWLLMDLTIRENDQLRRYVIRPRETQLILIAIGPVADEPEETLAEIQINEHQLSGINRIIETIHPYIGLVPSAQSDYARFRFSNESGSGMIHVAEMGGGPFRQLAEQLDMMLGIPSLKA